MNTVQAPSPDLLGLGYAVGLLVLLAALGKGIDIFLLPTQLKALRGWLETRWIRISDSKVTDLPIRMAKLFLTIQRRIFGDNSFSVRFVLVTVFLSIGWSLSVLWVGESYFYFELNSTDRLWDEIWTAASLGLSDLPDHQLHFALPANLALDTMTILITLFFLKRFIETASAITRLVLLMFDLSIALALAVVCFAISEGLTLAFTGVFGFIDIADFRNYFSALLAFETLSHASHGSFFLANSTLVPTLFYIGILVLLSIALLAYQLGKAILLHIFALSVETEKSIFFYTGTFLGLIAVSTKLLIEASKAFG